MGVSKNRVPENGWFINPIKMDDLGVPLFLKTPKCRESNFIWPLGFNGTGIFFAIFYLRIYHTNQALMDR